jgi:hypothetical protein
MNLLKTKQTSRRNFLKSIIRLGTLGSLVFIGMDLGLRENENKHTSSDCQLKRFCKRCNKWNACNYPQAQAAKDASIYKTSAKNKFDETSYERK